MAPFLKDSFLIPATQEGSLLKLPVYFSMHIYIYIYKDESIAHIAYLLLPFSTESWVFPNVIQFSLKTP